jgi:hypothetical protein
MDAKCYEEIARPLNRVIIPDEVLGEDDPMDGKPNEKVEGQPSIEQQGNGNTRPTKKRKTGGSSTAVAAAATTTTTTKKPTRRGRPAKLAPEEYDWICPVGERCGKTYKSIKRGGIWVPDPAAATQLFV